jgi:hypothetical protein
MINKQSQTAAGGTQTNITTTTMSWAYASLADIF